MADQVMTVDGNFKPYIEGARKAEEATAKVAKRASTIGKEVEGSLVKFELLKRVAEKALEAIGKFREDDISGSVAYGERQIKLREAANNLNLSSPAGLESSVKNRSGGGTLAGTMAFIESLGQYNKDARVPLFGKQAESLASSYSSLGDPIFGHNGSDIIESLKRGESPENAVKRLVSLRSKNDNRPAYEEAYLRNREDSATLATEWSGRQQGGYAARLYDAENKQYNASGEGGVLGKFLYNAIPKGTQQLIDENNGTWSPDEGISEPTLINRGSVDALMESIKMMGNAYNSSVTKPNGAVEVK